MEEKKKICFVILSLLILLLFGDNLRAEPMQVTENLRKETIFLPPSAPAKSRLIQVSLASIVLETEIIGTAAVYDDAQTKRPVDYLELYDSSGNLLSASWIDRFGILRTAMDRGLLQEESPRLEGVLILLLEGTPL